MSEGTMRPRNPIDWEAARARLAQIEAAVEGALNPTPERAKDIMAARARALAQVPASARPAGACVDVILFSLGRERYGIETRFVREVVRLDSVTPVPGVPDFVVGITNLRGAVLAVFDLRRLFNVPNKGLTDLSRVIVLGTDRVEFGVLADEANGQADIAIDEILAQPDEAAGDGRPHLRGVTRQALIILDGAALLGDSRLVVDTSGSGT